MNNPDLFKLGQVKKNSCFWLIRLNESYQRKILKGRFTGNMKSIGLRASNIRTFDGAEVIVPNGQLVSNEVINWTFFNSLGESSLDFIMLAWIADYSQGRRIKSEILFRIFEVLKENNIEMPFPQRDLNLRSVDQSIRFRGQPDDKESNPEWEQG